MIEEYNKQLAELDEKMKEEIDAYQESAQDAAEPSAKSRSIPKKDIVPEFFGLGWLPHTPFKDGERWVLIRVSLK